jgi:hypothetical protein
MENRRIPYAKYAGIAGLILGEVYMVFTIGGPRLKDASVPTGPLLLRMLAASPFFGAFGLAIGTGVGLLLDAVFNRKSAPKTQDEHPRN